MSGRDPGHGHIDASTKGERTCTMVYAHTRKSGNDLGEALAMRSKRRKYRENGQKRLKTSSSGPSKEGDTPLPNCSEHQGRSQFLRKKTKPSRALTFDSERSNRCSNTRESREDELPVEMSRRCRWELRLADTGGREQHDRP